MTTIQTKAHVEAGGRLSLTLDTGLPEADVDVLVVVQPAPGELPPDECDWPTFVERYAGCMADDPIERGDQGTYEQRETLEDGPSRTGSRAGEH
jgi:hypothetical protein